MAKAKMTAPPDSPAILWLQLSFALGFTLFAGSVIGWVGRLIYISWALEDVFSASIGIALVAVPIFCFLLYIFHYVFWGLRAGRPAAAPPKREKKK